MQPIDDTPSREPGETEVDLALSRGLEEAVGGARPPDVRAAVLAALGQEAIAEAGQPVERAWGASRWLWSAALVLLGVSVVVAALVVGPGGPAAERSPASDRGAIDAVPDADAGLGNGAADVHGGERSWEPPQHPHVLDPADLDEVRSRLAELQAVEFVPCRVTYRGGKDTGFFLGPCRHEWERDPAVLRRWRDAIVTAPEVTRSSRGFNEYRAHVRLWVTDPRAEDPAGEQGRYLLVAIDEALDPKVYGAGAFRLPDDIRTEWRDRIEAAERAARLEKGVVYSGDELDALDVKTRMIRGYGLLPVDLERMYRFKHSLTLDLSASPGIDQDALGTLAATYRRRREANEGWGSVNRLIAPRGMLWGKTALPRLSDLGPLTTVVLDHSIFVGSPAAATPRELLGGITGTLSLREARLDREWLSVLAGKALQLRTIDLAGASGLDPTVVETLAAMPKLQDLSLAFAKGLENADLGALSVLPLARLDLRGQDLEAAAFRKICECVRLEELALDGELPEDAVDRLFDLPRLRSLTLRRPLDGIEKLSKLVLLRRIEFTKSMWAPEIEKVRDAFEATGSEIELKFRSNW